jgi:two-component system cell cycle sensor histidine kinase/response regulator CckA
MSESNGSKLVLVVDDSPVALEFCCTVLNRAGYRVKSASGGELALTFFQPDQTPVDIALIDIVMPGMSGIELANRLEKLSPGTRIVLMSGYTADEIKKVVGDAASRYRAMWKPFQAEALLQMIENVLQPRVRAQPGK